MEAKMSLVAQARAQALTALSSPAVSTERILLLKKRLLGGEFNGRNCRYCFFGILGGESQEGYESVREAVGMKTPPGTALRFNPVEVFSFMIYRGGELELLYSMILLDWVNFELSRRTGLRREFRTKSTTIPVSVTEEEMARHFDSLNADLLIEETRFPEHEPARS